MHTVSYEFLMKPEESARGHQTLSSLGGGWARDYLLPGLCHCPVFACAYIQYAKEGLGGYYHVNDIMWTDGRILDQKCTFRVCFLFQHRASKHSGLTALGQTV